MTLKLASYSWAAVSSATKIEPSRFAYCSLTYILFRKVLCHTKTAITRSVGERCRKCKLIISCTDHESELNRVSDEKKKLVSTTTSTTLLSWTDHIPGTGLLYILYHSSDHTHVSPEKRWCRFKYIYSLWTSTYVKHDEPWSLWHYPC